MCSMLALLIILSIVGVSFVAAQDEDYLTLEGAGFAGRCNLRFYEHDASKVATTESIRYIVVYILSQADDDESLIMSGNWSAGTTVPNGALVMGWTSIYGPYHDRDAYEAQNCSECDVAPDYFWVAWGLQGDYATRWMGYNSPYLTLDGIGLGVDWDSETVESLGEISMRGRMSIRRVSGEPELRYYRPQIMIQALHLANNTTIDAPHWNTYKGASSKLSYMEDGADCWDNLLGDYSFICDWLYDHFGLDICPEGQE